MSVQDRGQILFVVGMHRSGTSALCAALAACGTSFGGNLIDPMVGVNEEGFWEDTSVVALNEQLLAMLDSAWYAPAPLLQAVDWGAGEFAPLRAQATAVLRTGFGKSPLQAVKDPRLCLTLPFWLALCADLGIAAQVCVISRAPLEVARSLEKRDGFPLGYGLRLWAIYRDYMDSCVSADVQRVAYGELLQDARAVMARLALALPITVADDLAGVVRADLRHQAVSCEDLLSTPDVGQVPLAELSREIAARFPVDEVLRDFARALVARGQELSRIGREHTVALSTLDKRDQEYRHTLATLDERDADVEALSGQHRAALATIDERDEQIREFDRRLAKLGEEHTHALAVVRERDAQLEYIYNLPGIGLMVRLLKKNAQG